MAGKISFECPGCSAKLSVTDRSKLGKKIKCPKCQEVFLPEAPEDDEVEDFSDDFEDEVEESPAPRKRGGGGAPKKGGGRGSSGKSSGGGNNGAVIGGGIAAVLLLGGLGLFFSGAFSTKPAPMYPDATPMQANATPVAAPVSAPPQMSSSAPGAHGASSAPGASSAHGGTVPTAPLTPPRSAAASTALAATPAEKLLGLRWMPFDTDVIVHVKVAELWQSPLLKGPLSNPMLASQFKEFEAKLGMQPSDIESISAGLGDMFGMTIRAAANAPASPGGFPGGPPSQFAQPPRFPVQELRGVVVVKAKKPFDLALIAKSIPNATIEEKNGKKILNIPANPPGMEIATGGWTPDPNTLILATSKELATTIEKGETVIPRKEFSVLDSSQHFILASLVRSLKKDEIQLLESKKVEIPGGPNSPHVMSEQYGLQLAGVGITVKGGIDLQVTSLSGTADGANKIKANFENVLNQAKIGFEVSKKTLPPLFAELGEMLVANASVEEKNKIVKLQTNIPDSAQDKLEQLPPMLMMMAMTGGIPGMGRPLGGAMPGAGETAGLGGLKQPGETESVPSAKAEGLPDGMTITAKTAWSPFPAIAPDGTASITMEVLVDVTGDGLDTICGSAGIAPTKMTLDAGGKLKKSRAAASDGVDPQKTFLHYGSEDDLLQGHPPKTLRVRFMAEAPPPTATRIDAFEGSFKFLSSANSHEMTIEEAPKRAKRPLAGPEFKAAEVKLRRSPPGVVPEFLSLWCGKDHFIGQVKGSPGDVVSVSETDKDQSIQRLYAVEQDGKFPEDFQIAFKLFMNVEEKAVTFRFENIPLPTPDSKPQFQPQFQPQDGMPPTSPQSQ